MILLNENEWASKMIELRELGKKPYETICRVAKYYIDNGVGKNEIKIKIEEFMLSCDKSISLIAWSDTIDRAIKYAYKYPAINISGIGITQKEIDTVRSLDGVQLQRLAFTLLCISKYNVTINPKTDYWVSTPDNEIMKMANINTSVKRQSTMFGILKESGLIKFSKRIDNLSVRVMFADEEQSDFIMKINTFENLGNQYMMFSGHPYFVCEGCGITYRLSCVDGRGRPQRYCTSCAAKIRTEQNVNSVMRRRALKNETVGNK